MAQPRPLLTKLVNPAEVDADGYRVLRDADGREVCRVEADSPLVEHIASALNYTPHPPWFGTHVGDFTPNAEVQHDREHGG